MIHQIIGKIFDGIILQSIKRGVGKNRVMTFPIENYPGMNRRTSDTPTASELRQRTIASADNKRTI